MSGNVCAGGLRGAELTSFWRDKVVFLKISQELRTEDYYTDSKYIAYLIQNTHPQRPKTESSTGQLP